MPQSRYPFVKISVQQPEVDIVSMLLWEHGAQAVEERDETTMQDPDSRHLVTLVGGFSEEGDAHSAIAALKPFGRAEMSYVVGDRWRDEWKRFFEHQRMGKRLVVGPPWESWKKESGDVVVTIDPGRAFGSGLHESTRLLLTFLDSEIKGGEAILDVGTGSGVLAIAALKLGSSRAVAVDIDPLVVPVAQENAKDNDVLHAFEGSTKTPAEIEEQFDVVLANIQAEPLVQMAPELARRTNQGGKLALSGVLAERAEDVNRAFTKDNETGLHLIARPQMGEWVALMFSKSEK